MPRRGENIRKRSDGRWEGRIKEKTLDGKTKYRSLYAHSYGELRKKMNEYASTSKSLQKGEKTVDDIALAWLETKKALLKYSTYVKYKNIYCNHIQKYIGTISSKHFSEDDYSHIIMSEFLDETKLGTLSKSTLNTLKYVLIQIIKQIDPLLDVSIIKNDVASIKTATSPVSVFTETEQTSLMHYLTTDIDIYKLGVIICLFTGMRLGEICALKIEDIDIDNKLIHVQSTVQRLPTEDGKTKLYCMTPKTNSSIRDIPICDYLFNLMVTHLHSDVFLLSHNKPTDPRTMQNKYRKYLQKAGIRYRKFHTLRHSFATKCISNGMDIKCLSEILGHSDVQTTLNKYVHPSLKTKRDSLNKCMSISGQNNGHIPN